MQGANLLLFELDFEPYHPSHPPRIGSKDPADRITPMLKCSFSKTISRDDENR